MLSNTKYKYLHFKPSYETPLLRGMSYYDISNCDLCRWNLDTFELMEFYPKVTEAYYVKLLALGKDSLVIIEKDIMKVFNTVTGQFTDRKQLQDFIEEIETLPDNNILVCTIAGTEQNQKMVMKWKLAKDGKLELVAKISASFQANTYDALFMLKVFPSGKVFIYERGTDKIYEIHFDEKQVKAHIIPTSTTALLELHNKKDFAVASNGKIDINDPTKGSSCAYIDCKDEIYNTIIQLGGDDVLITASNKAVKLWPMKESKAEPQVFSKSERMAFNRLQINRKMLIGFSDKAKTIAIWDIATKQLVRMEKILKQQLQRSIKLNDKHLCLVVKVLDETEDTLSYHHKLEVINVNTDQTVHNREIKKAGFNINVESVIRFDDETIRFICYSDNIEKPKEYLFTWKPNCKEQKKDMTKVDMLLKAPITKLYTFDRILFVIPPKEKVAVFNAFGKNECKTQVIVGSHAMKKLCQLTLDNHYDNFQLAPQDILYVIDRDKTEILSYQNGKLNKLRDIKISLLNIHSIGNYVLTVNAQGDRRLYDYRFDQLVVKADVQNTEPILQIVPIQSQQFLILYKNQQIELWDIDKQDIQQSKLNLVVIDVTVADDSLFVTQLDRIEVLDIYRIFV